MEATLISHVDTRKIDFPTLQTFPTPKGTATHKPIPHHEVVQALIETLGFRHIGVHKMEFAVSDDGNKMFGLMELDQTFDGARFALGLRNSHDKSMRLAMTIGYRVFVCDNLAFHGDFTPVLAKHSKNFNLTHALATGVDDMQRNFDPMVKAVETWKGQQITDVSAKMVIYEAFVEGKLDIPRHLVRDVHHLYFNNEHGEPEFKPRTMWSLSNCFTGALKTLDPIAHFKATGKLAAFLGN